VEGKSKSFSVRGDCAQVRSSRPSQGNPSILRSGAVSDWGETPTEQGISQGGARGEEREAVGKEEKKRGEEIKFCNTKWGAVNLPTGMRATRPSFQASFRWRCVRHPQAFPPSTPSLLGISGNRKPCANPFLFSIQPARSCSTLTAFPARRMPSHPTESTGAPSWTQSSVTAREYCMSQDSSRL
jgi:hypothetical protein